MLRAVVAVGVDDDEDDEEALRLCLFILGWYVEPPPTTTIDEDSCLQGVNGVTTLCSPSIEPSATHVKVSQERLND